MTRAQSQCTIWENCAKQIESKHISLWTMRIEWPIQGITSILCWFVCVRLQLKWTDKILWIVDIKFMESSQIKKKNQWCFLLQQNLPKMQINASEIHRHYHRQPKPNLPQTVCHKEKVLYVSDFWWLPTSYEHFKNI